MYAEVNKTSADLLSLQQLLQFIQRQTFVTSIFSNLSIFHYYNIKKNACSDKISSCKTRP